MQSSNFREQPIGRGEAATRRARRSAQRLVIQPESVGFVPKPNTTASGRLLEPPRATKYLFVAPLLLAKTIYP